MKGCASDLNSLIRPFTGSESSPGALSDEARALLSLVADLHSSGKGAEISRDTWHEFLDVTGRPDFLGALGFAQNEEYRDIGTPAQRQLTQ